MTIETGASETSPQTGNSRRAAGRRLLAGAPVLSEPAAHIRARSVEVWDEERAVEIIGRSPTLVSVLEKLEKIAPFPEPVLILGESGVGKELLAQAAYLLSGRTRSPFVSVNCPQFQEGNLTVSELFGHTRGSFTGAVDERKGCFETAGKGVIFLDEIGDLHLAAQMMLLRALATGEFQPLGAQTSRRVHARILAATNQTINQLSAKKHFRRDLFFRLRYFLIEVPPLRERGDDWRLLVDHTLGRLHRRHGIEKRFSRESLAILREFSWPGNIRELIGLTTTAYALSDGPVIEPQSFVDYLGHGEEQGRRADEGLFRDLSSGGSCFWEQVQRPFLDRDLNRRQVQQLIERGLRQAKGRYRELLDLWHMPPGDYQKFMDFLRHHRLKPRSRR